MSQGRMIDAHAMLGEENHLRLEADELLRRMDANGIELALARPMGSELAVNHRAGNDRVTRSPSRIRGLVSVNPWFGQAALDELNRCRDLGAVGLFLHPSRQGFMPTEPIVDPIVGRASDFGWPIMLHTGTYIQSDILAVAELARRHPKTDFIAGFSGFTDMWFELPGVFGSVANLYMDCSMIWGVAIEEIVSLHGSSRVLFGGAEPRNRYSVVLKMIGRLKLSPEQLRDLVYNNAQRIYRLP